MDLFADTKSACAGCGEYFRCKLDLKQHVCTRYREQPYFAAAVGLSPHLSPPHMLPPAMQEDGIKPPMLTDSDKKLCQLPECPTCGQKFADLCSMQCHMETHAGLKSHTCEECNKTFSHATGLQQHMRTHTTDKPFTCQYCDQKFRWRYAMEQHMQLHTGVKAYECPECLKKFSQRAGLQQHMRTHSTDKPYRCPNCDQQFRWRYTMEQHVLLHSGIKTYACQVCEKKFSQRAGLQQHMRTHTTEKPFKCKFCDMKFKCRFTVEQHMQLHSSVKAYECPNCDKKFSQRAGLQQHAQIHSDTKPHRCPHCEMEFKWHHAMQYHVRTHHGNSSSEEKTQQTCRDCGENFKHSGDLMKHMSMAHGASQTSDKTFLDRDWFPHLPENSGMLSGAHDVTAGKSGGGTRCEEPPPRAASCTVNSPPDGIDVGNESLRCSSVNSIESANKLRQLLMFGSHEKSLCSERSESMSDKPMLIPPPLPPQPCFNFVEKMTPHLNFNFVEPAMRGISMQHPSYVDLATRKSPSQFDFAGKFMPSELCSKRPNAML